MFKLEELERLRIRNVIKKQLESERVLIKKCLYTSAEIKKKWELAFLTHMTDTEKEDCHINEYLLHAFTYGKMNDYLEGKDAIKAFNNETKDEIYIF